VLKNLLPFIGRIDGNLSRKQALYFALQIFKQLYQARYHGSRSCFEVCGKDVLTQNRAGLTQQKSAINTNNEL